MLGRVVHLRRDWVDPKDKARYVAWRNRTILPLLRLGLFAGGLLYVANYFGDAILDPEGAKEALPLRVASAIVLLAVGLLSYRDVVKARPRTVLVCLVAGISVPSTLIGLGLEGGGVFHIAATQLATGIFAVLIAREFVLVAVLAVIILGLPNLIVGVLGTITPALVSADLLLGSGCIGMVILSYYLELEAVRLFRATTLLAHQAETDALTGVANRRSILAMAADAFAHATARRRALSVLMLDIDHFKRINDRHGHAAGDKVLALVARACGASIRGLDSLGRIGGEEFLVISPQAGAAAAARIAERLRTAVKRARVAHDGTELGVTISVGVASLSASDSTVDGLIKRADAALYAAKTAGRDCVEISRPNVERRRPREDGRGGGGLPAASA